MKKKKLEIMSNLNVDSITLHQQQYIETIYSLCKQSNHAHAKDIAERLTVKMPSVTEALRNLQVMGLVNYKVRQAVTLTSLGTVIGDELAKRHKVFSTFLSEILGVEKGRADEVACRMEHVVDVRIRERFSSFLGYLKKEVMQDENNIISEFIAKYNGKKDEQEEKKIFL
jgi:DtxR family transcriptional regulator, Mn-dependent transcriptional regulator